MSADSTSGAVGSLATMIAVATVIIAGVLAYMYTSAGDVPVGETVVTTVSPDGQVTVTRIDN